MMEKYLVGELDTTTLPSKVKKTPLPTPTQAQAQAQAPGQTNQSAGIILKILQYLVPLLILGSAFALQYFGKKSKSNES